jgi:deoxynucleotide monophosphate kinase-like protein
VLLIGFGHKARQGKNTAALAVLEACPIESHARLYAYADALRAEVKKAIRQFGCVADLISSFKEAGVMPEWVVPELGKQRTLLQWWGTDYRRTQDQDYWVKRLSETFRVLQPDIALVTDVRFPNEADAIKRAGGYLVRVVRRGKPDIDVPAHPSEQALDGYKDWDFTLTASTVPELKQKAQDLYTEIMRRQA